MPSDPPAFRVVWACLLGAALFASLGVNAPLLSAEPETIELRIPPVAGEPGELVTLEFWVTGLAAPDCCSTYGFEVEILLPAAIAEFVRLERDGTVAAAAPPRSAFLDPDFWGLGGREYPCILVGFAVSPAVPLPSTAEDGAALLLKADFRIEPEAAPEVHTIVLQGGFLHLGSGGDASEALAGSETSLEVLPPSGPRPVRDLTCSQAGEEVVLSWGLTETYDSVSVKRDGAAVATLAGEATRFTDRPQPGPALYEVVASRGGERSLPAECDLVVEVPRPEAVTGVTCRSEEGSVAITWTNGEPYDAIALFRNGHLIAELSGAAESYSDVHSSSLFTVYAIQGRVGDRLTLPAKASINAVSNAVGEPLIWLDEVPSWPGAALVPVRVFGTSPVPLSGFSVVCRIDTTQVTVRSLSTKGTAIETTGYDYFAGTIHSDGAINVGCVLDFTPPLEDFLPAGANQHLFTVVADVRPSVPDGTTVTFDVGTFPRADGGPPMRTVLVYVPDVLVEPRIVDGAILVGERSVPRVEVAAAELVSAADLPEGGAGGAAPPPAADSILLSWRNPVAYDSIRIEAHGKPLASLSGDRQSFLDESPGPGIHQYRIYGKLDGVESFPAVVTAMPPEPPGAFFRGDVDSDRAVNLTDAVALLEYLFRAGEEPLCLDAADADDDGVLRITDAIAILGSLFLGTGPLPAPGPEVPWFDPTEDGLSCRGS